MKRIQVRELRPDDFESLMRLEEEVFAAEGESTLGAYYVRLCCEFFTDTCFVALDGGLPVAYALCFVQGREAYCTTLAVAPRHQRSRVVHALLATLIRSLLSRVDSCWFTVKADNFAARSLHAGLGAREIEIRRDFYGPGDDRIVARIDREGLGRAGRRYARLVAAFSDDAALGSAA